MTKLSTSDVAARVARPGDERYHNSLSSYYAQQQAKPRPLAILLPESAQEVSTIISLFANTGNTRFSIRSGGHAQLPGAFNSDGGITIDLGRLDSVALTEDRRAVRIGTGARWGDAFRVLDQQDLSVGDGGQMDTGVGGLTLGGGLSWSSTQAGFVCDGVLDFEVVLADRTIVHATQTENADLWGALKGGGNNFGVVTSFRFRTFKGGMVVP